MQKSNKTLKQKLKSRQGQQMITSVLFLAIPLVLLIMLTYVPFVEMVRFSFHKWNGFGEMKFIGLQNYKEIFTRPEYFTVLKTSLYYLVGSFVQIGLALIFAYILNDKVKCGNFFKGTLFFPYLINGVAVGFIFLYFYQRGGTLDTLLTGIGIPAEVLPYWLKDTAIINISLAAVSIWRYLGQNMVMFSGAMQSISGDLYEAAALDGANKWQQFRYIVLPNIKTVVSINMILAVKGAISVFEIPYIMTDGGNGSATFVTKTLEVAFTSRKIGLASAMGVLLLAVILVITYIQKRFFEGGSDEYGRA